METLAQFLLRKQDEITARHEGQQSAIAESHQLYFFGKDYGRGDLKDAAAWDGLFATFQAENP